MIENEIGGSRKVRVLIFVALLVSSVGAIGALRYVNGYGRHCPHPTSTCINNLRLIDGAKQQWALEKRKGTNDIPAMTDIAQYIRGENLKCAAGGVYTLGRVAERPHCSIGGHVLP